MSDLQRLLDSFARCDRVRPDATEPNLVDLIRAVASIAGAPGLERTTHSLELGERIGTPRHLIFLLADGLGTHFIEDVLGPRSWLGRHLIRSIQTVYPSTTSAALTSVATGLWPATHSVAGWWHFLPQIGEPIVILPFLRLRDGAPLEACCQVTVAEAIPHPPLAGRLRRECAAVLPHSLVDSAYTAYLSGDARRIPYRNLPEAVSRLTRYVQGAPEPTYSYWYVADIDFQAHRHGVRSPEVAGALGELDEALSELERQLLGLDARVVVTADHGHLDMGLKIVLAETDPLCEHMATPPSGDLRLAFFHLRAGHERAFADEFRARFGEHLALISTDQLDDLRLLGPEPLTSETRRRLGSWAAISMDDTAFRYAAGGSGVQLLRQRSNHSGLSRQEMTVPFVVG